VPVDLFHQILNKHRLEFCVLPRVLGYAADLIRVERNMRLRRKRILSVLKPDEIAPTVTTFPLMGVGDFTGLGKVGGPFSKSSFVPDEVINSHPRFGTLTRNIRERRLGKVDIRLPLYHDENTPEYLHMNGGGACQIFFVRIIAS
jgi:glutamate--cysteine ligase catalytic subunit